MRKAIDRKAAADSGDRDLARVLNSLLRLAEVLSRPTLLRENELARRCFIEPGLAAMCRQGHEVRWPVESHVALFQALDWPRWEGISLATGAAQEAERRQPQDTIGRTTARVARYIATARLAFVRVTSQAGSRVRLEDLIGGRVLAGDSPELHVLELGECVVGRFIDNGKGRIWAVSDLLRVAPGAETRVRELALGPLPRRAPDELSGRAALLFRAWAAVAFGDGRSRIEPTAHAGELEDPDETWLDGDAGLHDR